jgi:A/G-specific adenine glycosylase
MAKAKIHQQASQALLDWYDQHHRDLPWRVSPQAVQSGERPNPYHVWLSEIMLQQTTVPTVKSYFATFTTRWQTVHDLASASRDDVMAAWAGLGYYARARNLHRAAEIIAQDHVGDFPDTEAELLTLPGIGAYTAAAIAAIAFGRRAVVVDGNIERVTARWANVTKPLPKAKPDLYQVMDALTPDHRAGDFAQAMMDLGAMICTPSRRSGDGLSLPNCGICPLRSTCATRGEAAAALPRKAPKTKRPDRHGVALIITDQAGHVALERRGDHGMLGGLDVFPGSGWADGSKDVAAYPIDADSPAGEILARHDQMLGGQRLTLNQKAEHIFSHFRVLLTIEKIQLDGVKPPLPKGWRWESIETLPNLALPTVMAKVARLGGLLA